MDPAIVYINGYPGVGKLTVARELSKLISNSKIIDNHHLIDPVAMLYDRNMPEYQPLRRAVSQREAVLSSIVKSSSTKNVTWICTDQQSSSPTGSVVALDYARAAETRRCRLVSVILHCQAEENERRITATGRGGPTNSKLTDLAILRTIREREDIYHFGGKDEVEIDVTARSAEETARLIVNFISEN
ncbi:MAG: hypothetical protein M1837_003813 [Sclerophora amabilis]|nr:MAG: hypothetical protein M1837_003813 [Sclerophora amabilis]